MAPTGEAILEALKQVHDPEIPVDIVNLGLVYEVATDAGTVRVKLTTTSPGCPVGTSWPARWSGFSESSKGSKRCAWNSCRTRPGVPR